MTDDHARAEFWRRALIPAVEDAAVDGRAPVGLRLNNPWTHEIALVENQLWDSERVNGYLSDQLKRSREVVMTIARDQEAALVAKEEQTTLWHRKADNAEGQVRLLDTRVESLNQLVSKAGAELSEFKGLVRSTLIELADDGTADLTDVNVILEGLGLAKKVNKYKVKVLVEVIVEDEVCDDDFLAREAAVEYVQGELSDSDSVRIEDVAYQNVEELES